MKKRILVCGNYGVGNLGDEAILSGILRLLESTFPGCHVTVMSSHPSKTARNTGKESIPFFPAGIRSWFRFIFTRQFLRVIRAVMKSDLIILGGGGLFADEHAMAVWIWFTQAWWFYLLRKKVVCLGQSVGPLRKYWAKMMTGWVFRQAVLVTVRDKQSADLLSKLGVKDVKVLADPAYALGYDSESSQKRNGYVVMSLRQWGLENSKQIDEDLAAFVKWLWKEKKLKTVFIAFQEKVESDVARYMSLEKLIDNKKIFSRELVSEDYRAALDIIGRADYVVGMRLHSIIFAVLSRKPFIALSYSKKVMDYVDTLGLTNYIDYKDVNFWNLKMKFVEAEKEYDRIAKVLEERKLYFTYEFFRQEALLRKIWEND